MKTWTITGWEQNLRGVSRGIQPLALEVIENAARDMVKTAQQVVPVRTGRLRASIGIGRVAVSAKRAVADVEARTPYAAFVEFGTVNMAPRSYMRNAARMIIPKFRRSAEVIGIEALTRSLT